jgi:hypothetical protein
MLKTRPGGQWPLIALSYLTPGSLAMNALAQQAKTQVH